MTPSDIYWVAGLLEGEGSFNYTYHRGTSPRITVHMTDLDVMEKFKSITGTTSLVAEINRGKPLRGWKRCYGITIYGSQAIGLMMTVYSLMGERRKMAIRDIVRLWKAECRVSLHQWRLTVVGAQVA